MGQIEIKNLEIFANHGVLKEENVLGQKFIISVLIDTDISQAAKSDDIEKSINYAEVCTLIRDINEKNTFKLIETLADAVAIKILNAYKTADKVTVNVKKPNAPIHMNFEHVSVTSIRRRHRAYISFGSNMGDKEQYITNAINTINNNEMCKTKKISSLIATPPYGGVEQEDFLNGCMEIETIYSPTELLSFLQKIESDNGRVRTIHWGPRTLDLDIVFFDDEIIYSDNLIVPHPDMQNRRFVLEPLCEIAPFFVHPVLKKSISDLKKALLSNA